jgi:hypothetical protein
MTRSMTVTVCSERVSVSTSIAKTARFAPLLILTARAFRDLSREMGSDDAAVRFLLRVSEQVNKPIGCNFPAGTGSRTAFLAPASWTHERLRGWVGGKRDEIEHAFGAAVPLPLEDL